MLFLSDDLKLDADQITRTISTSGNAIVSVGSENLKKHLPLLEPCKIYHYVTSARWSMHDLLEHLLTFTGPADVYFTTWSITMVPAQRLVKLKQLGAIKTLHAIVDSRVKVNAPQAFQLLMMNTESLKLVKLHAKVLVIKNDSFCATVISSQNFTNVKRVETGVIDTNPHVADFHSQWIKLKIDEPDKRIHKGRIE
jgi:hypothetical protein